jgi:tetratricopeptide (TPR) repeat protein
MFDKATQTALLDEAIGAAKGGDRIKAKDKLTRYLRYDQKNEHAWLWMSSVVESDRERIFCLTNVLKLNPNNKIAKRGLALLGALPAEMRGDLEIEIIGVDLKADVTTAGAGSQGQRRSGGFTFRRNRRLENIVIVVLALILITGCILFGLNVGNSRVAVAGLMGIKSPTPAPTQPPPTATPLPTDTPVPPTPTEVAPIDPIAGAAQTPIAQFLGLPEYTPTPEPIKIPGFPEEEHNRGVTAYKNGNYDSAITSFNAAIKRNKDNYAAQYYLGLIYLAKKDYNKAFNSFGAALRLNSGFAPAYLGRGQANFGLGGNPLADYQKAKDAAPDWVEPYIQSALFYADRRNPESAITELETARQFAPNNVTVYWNLAEQYLVLGRIDNARENLLKGLEVDGTALDLYRVQAKLLLADKNYADALTGVNIFISYRPADAEGWTLQGQAYKGLGENEKALVALNRAVELKPDDPREALIARGAVQLILGNADTARADFDKALQLGITTRNRLLIGQAYYEVGDYDTAVTEFSKAVDSDKTAFDTNFWLGAALVGNKQFEDALDALNDALSKANSDQRRFDAFYMRGKAYEGLDQREDAIRDLRDALVLNVTDRTDQQADATLILSRLDGPAVDATQTPTAQP